MAYKLLSTVLPVDIVNKVLEYSVYYDIYEQHLCKIHNNTNIVDIADYMYAYGGQIEIIKKSNYAETRRRTAIYKKCYNIVKIVEIVPKDILNTEYSTRTYLYKTVIKCNECNDLYWKCLKCDYSLCKDYEIFKSCLS